MGDYFKSWSKPGPRSLKGEAISLVLWAVYLAGLGLLFHWTASEFVLVLIAVYLGTTSRYVWWHFRPYQPPPPQPVTRYTKHQ